MKVVEVSGTSYPDAHELPNKSRRPAAKHQKSTGSSSAKKGTDRIVPGVNSSVMNEQRKKDQVVTAASRKVLVIEADGKRHFVRANLLR